MGAYLIDNSPTVQQFYKTRNRPLTGCTVLHTAESLMDAVGPDTGAESVAEFIRRRTTAGSYHDIADSDSYVPLVPYESGAFHDGTGSNNWALSISFACRTSDWRAMSPEKRRGFLWQGARAFAAQQAWRKVNGYPLTELLLISKAQSDAGASGFIYHGLRDPGRRSDPGVASPDLFPFDEWITECRAALAGTTTSEEDDDMARFDMIRNSETGEIVLAAPGIWQHIPAPPYIALYAARGLIKSTTPMCDVNNAEFQHFRAIYLSNESNDEATLAELRKLSADEAARAAAS